MDLTCKDSSCSHNSEHEDYHCTKWRFPNESCGSYYCGYVVVNYQKSSKEYYYYTKIPMKIGQTVLRTRTGRTAKVIKTCNYSSILPKYFVEPLPADRTEEITEHKKEKNMKIKSAIKRTKETVIKTQRGMAALAAINSALIKSPLPDNLKEHINTPTGNIVVGLLAGVAADSFDINFKIKEVLIEAQGVASVDFSTEFTVITDLIEETIKGIDLPEIVKTVKK